MQSYIILGHCSETLGSDKIVPPGCLLVLTEECGMLGSIPWTLYAKFADPENKILFDNPIKHKVDIEKLLGRSIYVLKAGDNYPDLHYTLLSYTNDDTLEPSGLYPFPTPDFIFNPGLSGRNKYVIDDDFDKAFKGALLPAGLMFSRSLEAMKQDAAFRVSQETLFQERPGVYYNLLCRELKTEVEAISELMIAYDPKLDIDGITGSFDFFASVNYWLSTIVRDEKKAAILDKIEALVADVISRRARHDNSSKKLITMLNTSVSPSLRLIEAHLNMFPLNIAILDKHNNRTPLMVAAAMGHVKVVDLLIRRGANLDMQDIDGETALVYAIQAGEVAVVELLLMRGAKVDILKNDGGSVLHAMAEDDIFKDLLQTVVRGGLDVNGVDENGDTALHVATDSGSGEIIVGLTTLGANCNFQNVDGVVPLMIAIEAGNRMAFNALISKTDLGVRNGDGANCLDLALDMGYETFAVDLVKAGIVDDWKKVLRAAKKYKMDGLLKLIKEKYGVSGGGGRKTTRASRVV
jgi:ankyrin repeat protein